MAKGNPIDTEALCQTDKRKTSRQAEEEISDQEDSSGLNKSHSSDDGPQATIKPVSKKIGEGRDQLRRRQEWFQRRSGSR